VRSPLQRDNHVGCKPVMHLSCMQAHVPGQQCAAVGQAGHATRSSQAKLLGQALAVHAAGPAALLCSHRRLLLHEV
jgi:hypothetical protein